MPDDNVTITQKQETVEVIGLDGNPARDSGLAGIFDAMEKGKEDGLSNKEILSNLPKKEEKVVTQEKKEVEEKKPDTDLDKKLEVKGEKKEEVEETDPRKALQKAFEKRQEEKDEKTNQKTEDKKDGDEVSEEELKPLPNDKPKTVKRIQALLKKIDTVGAEAAKTKAERDEKATKLADLEKKLADVQSVNPETNEKVKKQLDELAMYRRRYELDVDPDVKNKFDGRVEAAETSIVDILKKRNAGEGLLNLIKAEGGWHGFSSSTRLVTVPDGEGGTKQVSTAELAELVLAELPFGDRKAIEAATMEQVSTRREKDRFFKEEQAKANEFFKKREDESKKASEDQQKQVQEGAKIIQEWVSKVEKSDWLQDKQVPEKATAQEKAAITEHNRYNGQLKSFLRKAIETKDLNGMLEVVEDSVRYYDERRTTAALKDENKRLKDQLKAKDEEFTKFKNAGRSVQRSGSISSTSVPESQRDRAPKSLEEALMNIESGKNREVMMANED